ncbi:MAG: hypothetical protein COA67_06515 [Lutibacter sp.]|nr:MAG: hypothetical protein COA67_06515 [Lutibacter sp.]
MIKFFRKIRQNLLMENKTGKYFKYAIGEIVLVVIGILIALQINNWNETRKQINTQNAIYLIVKEDLETDISGFESFIYEYNKSKKPAFEAVLNKELTREDWENNPSYLEVMKGYEDLAISKRGIDQLKKLSGFSNNLEEGLTSDINKFYTKHILEFNTGTDELGEQFTRNYIYFQNFDWYASFLMQHKTDGFIDSFYNEPTIKSRIATLYFIYRIYITDLENYVTNAKTLIVNIDNHLKEIK